MKIQDYGQWIVVTNLSLKGLSEKIFFATGSKIVQDDMTCNYPAMFMSNGEQIGSFYLSEDQYLKCYFNGINKRRSVVGLDPANDDLLPIALSLLLNLATDNGSPAELREVTAFVKAAQERVI